VLVGDFNLSCVDWNSLNSPDDDIHSAFLQFCVHYGLYQFVKVPTPDDHILDLVISSDHSIMSELQVVEAFSTSDHFMVEFSLILGHHDNCSSSPAAVYYDYVNADYDGIVSHLLNDSVLSRPVYDQGETADHVWEKISSRLTRPCNFLFLLNLF